MIASAAMSSMHISANAATVHRSKLREGHLRTRQRVTVRPGQRVAAPTRFAVPG